MEPVPLALVLYSAQIVVVVCVATVAAALGRLSVPAVRLAYWRGVGALCLVLPFFATTHADVTGVVVAFGAGTLLGAGNEVAAPPLITVGAAVFWAWAVGAVARLGWLLVGGWGLWQLRRRSIPAMLGVEIDALRKALAPHAEFRWSGDLKQPVTFGVRRPLVLLPQRFGGLSADAQVAVACHELLHVARRDWVWIVIEEHVRALFWFHPGIWWLVDRVQLAREEVIDRLVVARTAARRAYMSALMTFADGGPSASLSIAFIRHRHLKSRFRHLAKESQMSFRRLAWTVAALAVVMSCAALGAAWALPLDVGVFTLQGREKARLEIRLAEIAPAAGLIEAAVSGSDRRVYLHAETLATAADVTGARAMETGGSQFAVGVTFSDAASARMMRGTEAHLGRPVAIMLDGNVIAAPTVRAPISDSAVISGITASAALDLATRLAVAAALLPMPAPVESTSPQQQNAGATQDGQVVAPGEGVTLPKPTYEVKPQYTPAAMQVKIEGTVLLAIVVQTDGTVGRVQVTKSLDTTYGLDDAAVRAARQWRFVPGRKDGKPVAVEVALEMTFTLRN